MQRTTVAAKKVLNSGLMVLKKNGHISILPKAFLQVNPFLTRRLMSTGIALKPGATASKNKKVNTTKKGNTNKKAISGARGKVKVTSQAIEVVPWIITEQVVVKEIGITEVFEEITSEGKLIPEKDRLVNLEKCTEALNKGFADKFGTTPIGLLGRFAFSVIIKDPSKLGELLFNVISVKNSFSGHYSLMNKDLRAAGKGGIKTGVEEQSDHGIAVSDVGLKLIIQSLRYTLPTLEEFEEIYKALNHKSNRRAVPNDVHKIISGLEAHELDSEGKRMLSIQEKLEKLSPTNRKKLNKYLKEQNKNFGTIQEEYCENFVKKLKESESIFVQEFAENFEDFYINHVLYKVQRGGGFDSEEETLLVFLLNLLKDEPTINMNNTNNKKSEVNSDDDYNFMDVTMGHYHLRYIKNLMDGFFKTAKDIYQSASKQTDQDILDRYDAYLKNKDKRATRVELDTILKNVDYMEPKKEFMELKGGKTRKLYRRR